VVSPTVSGNHKSGESYRKWKLFKKKATDFSVAFLLKENIMKQKRLMFYHIDMKYIRNLAQKDDIVRSVSPQRGKENRPFVGIVVICKEKKYCIPLSSPKPKHYQMKVKRDLLKIMQNDKIIGILNFNSMIPVDDTLIKPINLQINSTDTPDVKHYKNMTKKQLSWCQKNQDLIVHKANQLYNLVTERPKDSIDLTKRCCDFKKLETVLQKYISKKAERVEDKEALSQPKDVRGFIKKKAQEISKQPHKEQPSKDKDKNSQSR